MFPLNHNHVCWSSSIPSNFPTAAPCTPCFKHIDLSVEHCLCKLCCIGSCYPFPASFFCLVTVMMCQIPAARGGVRTSTHYDDPTCDSDWLMLRHWVPQQPAHPDKSVLCRSLALLRVSCARGTTRPRLGNFGFRLGDPLSPIRRVPVRTQ